jgi:UDPglucose 6-dehydrogenase
MRVLVVGSGYVGLVAAACFAEAGHRVLGVDVDAEKVARLRRGESPIYEPGLDELLARHLATGSLAFGGDVQEGIVDADAAFICVGTPMGEDGSADMRYILQVASELGRALPRRPYDARPLVVVDKSTVPVGTAARVAGAIQAELDAAGSSAAFEVVSNPEFLREGSALEDFLRPDRVVVGCRTDYAESVMKGLYGAFLEASGGRWFRMDPASAELTKYAANAMLAMRISFINEVAALCEEVGADVDHVKTAIGADHRIGPAFLNPGPGFGGSCFPKDLQALLKTGREHGISLKTLNATVEANRHQKMVLLRKVKAHYGVQGPGAAPLGDRRFALWGLAFKAHTDDIRESMSLELIEGLLSLGATVAAHDFEAMPAVRAKLGDRIDYAPDPLAACEGADALLVATEWPQYKAIDLQTAGAALKTKVMFDGRNLFRPETMKHSGWVYHSLGRRTL